MVQTQHQEPHSLRSSLLANIYILSTLASLCSLFLAFSFILGPLFVLIPWLMFYGFKRGGPLFRDWTWMHVLFVMMTVYFVGVMIAQLYFLIIFRATTPVHLMSVFAYLAVLTHSVTYFQRTLRSISYDSDHSSSH